MKIVIGHEGYIVYPPSVGPIDYETELAAVVRKKACRVDEADAPGP